MPDIWMLACPQCNLLFPQYLDAFQHFRYHEAHQKEVRKAIDMFGTINEQNSIENMMKVIEVPRHLSEQQQQWFQSVITKGRAQNTSKKPEVADMTDLADAVVSRLQQLSVSQTTAKSNYVTVNQVNHVMTFSLN